MRLLDRFRDRYRSGYWEGMASGAAVLMPLGSMDARRESTAPTLIAETQQLYNTNGVVWACILARMMLLSEATFKFQNRTDKSLTNLPPRAAVLDEPWPNGTSGELWARLEQDVSLAGNAFIWQSEPDRLVRLPPAEVTIVSEIVHSGGGKYRNVIGYDYDPSRTSFEGKRSEDAQFFTVDEVAHWSPYPDPNANFRGMSWLTPILRDIRVDNAFSQYKQQYVDHGTPVIAVKYDKQLRADTIDAVVERLAARYGGVANAFRPLVLDQGADPIIGPGLKDLDLGSVQSIGEARICSAAGVPPEVVGLRELQAEQYQPAVRRFADLTCRPLWRSGCAALQHLVSVPDGSRLWFDTGDIAALQAAETEQAQVTQVSAAAVLTFVQAGFERKSVISAVTSGDLSLLKPDPNAPTPGVNERETVAVSDASPVTGPGQISGVGGKKGVPPGGGAVLTKPQTAATKIPMPASMPMMPAGNGSAKNPTPNK